MRNKIFFYFFILCFLLNNAFCEEWQKEYVWQNPELLGVKLKNRPSPTENFAAYVNFDWYNKATIPSGYNSYDVFVEIAERLEDRVIDLINNEDGSVVAKLQKEYYNQAFDYAKTQNVDITPVITTIQQILDAKNINEITALLNENRIFSAVPTFISMSIVDDFGETKKYICDIYPAELTFNDPTVFLNPSPESKAWLKKFSALMVDLLKSCGIKSHDAKICFDNFIAVQTEMAKHKLPLANNRAKGYLKSLYNVYSFAQIKNDFKNFPLAEILEARGYSKTGKYLIEEPEFIKGLDGLYTEENLGVIKDFLVCRTVQLFVDYGNASHQKILKKHDKNLHCYMDFSKIDLEKFALRRTLYKFGNSLGKRYVEKYFPNELKKRIENITKNHIAIYRERLKKADWLSEKTKKLAIEKLDATEIVIGEPKNIPDTPNLFSELGKDWFDTYLMLCELEDKKVAAMILTMPYEEAFEDTEDVALTINAYNNWQKNRIFIPAGILQSPFYEDGYSDEELLGGIGAIIGHEISHSFDAMGSQFDKNGNLVNWWTEEDAVAFDKLNDAVEEYYGHFIILPDAKMEYGGVPLNGELTVTENVADLGGISCCLDQMRMLKNAGKNPDYKKFFETYAKVSVCKASGDFFYNLIMNDFHSMSYIRVNAVVQQFQEFYDTYGVKEGDKMYLAPEKRLKVW